MNEFHDDVVIGLEIHVELGTKSKLFCACANEATEEELPNARTCQVCLGHPGSKPVLNKKAVEFGIMLALATHSKIAPELIFSRKSYFYPDLSKNYQISQYEIPLATDGFIKLASGKKVGIERIHLEEDPAALVHAGGSIESAKYVLVDYNRSGTPLVEIVTRPELSSPEEAREFMKRLRSILEYLKIFRPEGTIKADVNVSIREGGYVRAEVKNVTGFREIERAVEYEVMRQKKESAEGKKFSQETRAWNAALGASSLLRKKETESDYGYIIDADLVRTDITSEWVARMKKQVPELADEKALRFAKEYRIDEKDAEVLSQDRSLAGFFEETARLCRPELAARWIRRELTRVLNYQNKSLSDIAFTPKEVAVILRLIDEKRINETTAQRLMEKLMEGPYNIEDYVNTHGLAMISDVSELARLCREAIAENERAVADFRAGNEKSLNFVIGQVMRKSKGKATPQEVGSILRKLLAL